VGHRAPGRPERHRLARNHSLCDLFQHSHHGSGPLSIVRTGCPWVAPSPGATSLHVLHR
jgi:hypothetical protein